MSLSSLLWPLFILMLLPLVSLPYLLNQHGRYSKLNTYLLQFLRHMTSDVKYLHMLFLFIFSLLKSFHIYELKYLGLSNKYWSVLKPEDLNSKNRKFNWNETKSKYIEIFIICTGKRRWWRPFQYSCRYEGLQLY